MGSNNIAVVNLTNDARLRLLLSVKYAVKDFYKKPENREAFEKWKKEHEEAQKK